VVRSNGTEAVRGAAAVAGRAFPFTRIAQVTLPALIDGAAGVVTAADGRPITLAEFTITGAKIVAIDLIDDPAASLKPTWPSSAADGPPTQHPLFGMQNRMFGAVRDTPTDATTSRDCCSRSHPEGILPLGLPRPCSPGELPLRASPGRPEAYGQTMGNRG
jgi:hypothetical protein